MGPYIARISFIKEPLTTLPKVLSIPNEQIFSMMGIAYGLEGCFTLLLKELAGIADLEWVFIDDSVVRAH